MNDRFIDTVYQSVIGQLQLQHHLEGVEDLFAPGCPCDQYYEEMRNAYERLLVRLGEENEDSDLEIIISSMNAIQKEVSYQMYRYGVHYGIADHIG